MSTIAYDFARATQWIDTYLSAIRDYPVLAQVAPGEITAALPANAPENGDSFDSIMADFERIIIPGITHWNHPRFFAYFATSAAPAAIAAEALAAALDVKAMLWRTSPSATELEDVVMRWLARLMGISDTFTGIIYDTASIGGFTALAAARESLNLDIREKGLSGRELPQLRVYITEHTHSHIEKAAIALGVGRENVVKIPCDGEFRMRPSGLKAQIEDDLRLGKRPMCVVATVGTTSTTSCDPVAEIGQMARANGLWLHVDAAYAGVAAILPEFRNIFDGVDHADSLVVNPHKWLFVPMDCSALYVRDPEVLRRAFSLVPDYLTTAEEGVRNYMDFGLQLGRRFRALKLWFVLRSFGAEGLRENLRRHIAFAQEFANLVRAEPGWEIVAPHPFSVVCFAFRPGGVAADLADVRNEEILKTVNARGQVFLSHTKIDGRFVLRMAIGNLQTTWDDVALAWRQLQEATVR